MHRRLLTAFIVAGLIAITAPAVLADTQSEVVTANDLENNKVEAMSNGKWFMYDDNTDTIDNGLGSFVQGPDTPPAGAGSVQFSVAEQERPNIATYRFASTPLADISTLAFSTYNPSAGNGGSANRSGYLQFNVSFDGVDSYQNRLVYVPGKNGTVIQDMWQEWDAIDGGDALWTWSQYDGSGGMWPDGNTTEYRTWSDIIASFPNAQIRDTDAFLGVRVGEPYPSGYTENIDAFKFGVDGNVTVVDFEPLIGPPENKDDCKDGGWQRFNNPAFENQGQCIKYVNKFNP